MEQVPALGFNVVADMTFVIFSLALSGECFSIVPLCGSHLCSAAFCHMMDLMCHIMARHGCSALTTACLHWQD